MKALSFEGTGLEYFKIWIVNLLLIIVTLGLYYPWAKVRNRRYFWANSVLEDRNFEYHATGKQLFLGYLFTMLVFIGFVLIQNVSPTGSLILFFVGILALPWIIWQSLKFNLRMTSFSNVKFSFKGLLGGAYVNYLLLPIAAFLAVYVFPIILAVAVPSLGLEMSVGLGVLALLAMVLYFALIFFAFSFLKKRSTSYAVNGYRFGQGEFSTNLQTRKFATILLKGAGLGVLITIGLMILLGLIAYVTGTAGDLMALQGNMEDPAALEAALQGGLGLMIGALYLGFIMSSLVVVAYLYTRQRQYIFANSRLDNKIDFSSTLKAKSLAWVMISNFIVVILTLGLAVPWAKVRMTRLILENTLVNTDIGFDEYVTQRQEEQSSLGEQLGDAFDVDVGIGF